MSTRQPKPQDSTPDRRRGRRSVSMSGFVLGARGISRMIEIVDLNYGGCGIRTPIDLTVGETVKISVPGRGSTSAQVRWYEDGQAGLVFEPVSEKVRERIARRASRSSAAGFADLRVGEHEASRVRTFDLSTDGCKLELGELVQRPAIGDQVMLKFEGLELIGATTAWVDEKRAGLKFERSFHPAVLDLLVARLVAQQE